MVLRQSLGNFFIASSSVLFGITCIVLENGDPDVVVLRVVKRNPGRGGGKLIPDSERP